VSVHVTNKMETFFFWSDY